MSNLATIPFGILVAYSQLTLYSRTLMPLLKDSNVPRRLNFLQEWFHIMLILIFCLVWQSYLLHSLVYIIDLMIWLPWRFGITNARACLFLLLFFGFQIFMSFLLRFSRTILPHLSGIRYCLIYMYQNLIQSELISWTMQHHCISAYKPSYELLYNAVNPCCHWSISGPPDYDNATSFQRPPGELPAQCLGF